MTSLDSYIEELRTSLALRDLPPQTIREILREVISECSTYDQAQSQFGAPDQYAAQYPPGTPRKYQTIFTIIGLGAALAWQLGMHLVRDLLFEPGSFTSVLLTNLPPLAFIAAGLLTDFLRFTRRARLSR
ncbi:hypothetical protein GcLGCM259_2936 [Glutamicibacter creatinolyticus]|uniref:Uncharacterized protein n=1 Tax=Glutamicibacter creatinolyticus TaxID=162496 RepID=A0A5B7WXJ2_9MICC|nr:hypothetical protein [Glutamicibacter creatinolyticus]QCY48642.1 hypothetical protein GcLGCM259_2936 [Glutamicibacter creatinolyticus]